MLRFRTVLGTAVVNKTLTRSVSGNAYTLAQVRHIKLLKDLPAPPIQPFLWPTIIPAGYKMTDYTVRIAAESLLGGSGSGQQYRTLSHSQSVNLVTEDLVAGHRSEGRMSTVRRFFCLFVTFDLLFTSLMWLICVMMKGETLEQILNREIVQYSVKISLFDIVLVAICRFFLLLLFYGVLHINNWSVIALTTSGTCAFLIAKVFMFDWPNAAQPVFQVFLILASFTLSWGEAWFLDFRVLPQELQAKQIIDAIAGHHNQSSERTPLLPHKPHGVASTVGESTAHWFSPVDSPAGTPRPGIQQLILTQEQIDEYKRMAEEGMQNAHKVITMPNWKFEKRGATKGDIVESLQTEAFGKVYRFTGLVDCPAEFLFKEFKDNVTKLPDWNPTLLRCELIKQIGSGIDLIYQVTTGGGRGIIAPRDFVVVRHCAPLSKQGMVVEADPYCYISSGVSVTVPGYPPNKEFVRGINKVGCWYLKPVAVRMSDGTEKYQTQFQWLMCCDLKGKIPQFVLDAAFASVMLDYIVHVRKFTAEARAKGLF